MAQPITTLLLSLVRRLELCNFGKLYDWTIFIILFSPRGDLLKNKIFIMTAVLVVCLFSFTNLTPNVHLDDLDTPHTITEAPDYSDDARFKSFRGRLYVPEVGIDVALYRTNKQSMCDRKDAACYFDLYPHDTMLIADHVTQAFGPLLDVAVGMIACIHTHEDEYVYMECVEVFDGYNYGHGILDGNKRNCNGRSDYLMYTCIPGRKKEVRVCLWNTIEYEPGEGIAPSPII